MTTMLAKEGQTDSQALEIPVLGWSTVHAVTVTASAASTSVRIPVGVTVVRLAWSVPCHILYGPANPVADTDDTLCPSPGWEYVKVAAGDLISVIKAAGAEDGILRVTECA